MSHIAALLPTHPGSLLRAKLSHLGCTTAAAARHLGVSRQTLYDIIREHQAITPSVALRVAKLTATAPEMWLNMQQEHDLAIARVQCSDLLKKVPALKERW